MRHRRARVGRNRGIADRRLASRRIGAAILLVTRITRRPRRAFAARTTLVAARALVDPRRNRRGRRT
jgi:hypothetical protein